jgi:hypothetical protein
MSQLFYPQSKRSWYPQDKRLGGPQTQSGHGGEEKNPIIAPTRKWTPDVQPTAQSRYWLSYPGTSSVHRRIIFWDTGNNSNNEYNDISTGEELADCMKGGVLTTTEDTQHVSS